MISSVLRGTGLGRLSQARLSRAKTKPGKDAGRAHSSAHDYPVWSAIVLAPAEVAYASRGRQHVHRSATDAEARETTPGTPPGPRGRPRGVNRIVVSSAMGPTEDTARRRFAAVKADSGSTDRTQAAPRGKSIAANQRIQLPCRPKHHKRAHLARARRANQGGGL